MMAISGKGFISSSYEGFYLMFRNAMRFSALSAVSFILVIFGRLLIALTTAITGVLIITNVQKFKDEIYSPVVPGICFGIIAYMIGAFFLTVYANAADTILTCYCIDEEVHIRLGKPT